MTQNPFEPSKPNPKKPYPISWILVVNSAILIAVAITSYYIAEDRASLQTYLYTTGGFLFMFSSGFVIAGLKDPMSAFTNGSGGGYVPALRPDEMRNVSKMMNENMRGGVRRTMLSFPSAILILIIAFLI